VSERERQVLRLVAEGFSNKAIARALAITERTAKFHVTSLLTKLGADNRAQAVALAIQRGLL
jgi:DNA-binding NarL/FixJ family response regulator